MPSPPQLLSVRSHIADTHPRLHRLVTSATFRRTIGTLDGERLSRVPRGYAKDHPAAHYLQFKQFLAGREFPAEFATTPAFYRELRATFRAVAPLVRFLNAGLRPDLTPQRAAPREAPLPDRARSVSSRSVPAPMW